MRILVISDFHLELGNAFVVSDDIEYDVAVLAVDIYSPGHKAVSGARRPSTGGGRPVAYMPVNHGRYNRELGSELALMRNAAAGGTLHLSTPGSDVLEGVRFIGCRLWNDFQLPVGIRQSVHSRARSVRWAQKSAR
jgi:hypothetical protein